MVERDDRNRRYRCQTRQRAFEAECQGQQYAASQTDAWIVIDQLKAVR